MATTEDSEEIQAEIEARRKHEEVVARELEEIAGEGPLESALETFEGKKETERTRREIGEEEEEKREWEREKQMREQLAETERVKKQGQAALERKGGPKEGKRGVETSDMGRQDWDQQAVQRQMALAEQRERHRIGERRKESRGSGGDEEESWERTKPTQGMEKDHEKCEGRRGTIEESGSCFRLSSRTNAACWKVIRMERKRRRHRQMEVMRKIGDGGFGHLWCRVVE